MEGFYSKGEAARILGVSVRQIQLYGQAGSLRRIMEGSKVWIPREDVDRMYGDRRSKLPVQHADVREIEDRLKKAEETIEVLKLGLGFGAERAPRTEAELLMIRQSVMDDLGQPSWPIRRMSEFADALATLREEDVYLLKKLKGLTALVPFFDLLRRMLKHVESHPSYPENGLDTLHARMVRSRDRVLGLLHAASRVKMDLSQEDAAKMHDLIDMKPGKVDSFVARYIAQVSTPPN